MKACSECQFGNPPEMKFCGQCGKPLSSNCPSCNFSNPPAFKFCGQCGHNLLMTSEAPQETTTPPTIMQSNGTSDKAARRQLTVMFCDLADSALFSDLLDPEEFRDIIKSYQAKCSEVINYYGGYIAQYLGDGILVYFGFPKAHEDDAKRAVYSALKLITAIEQLNQELTAINLELHIRIGIHTGLVVTDEIGSGERIERLALGRTPNIAARLQNLAGANQVYISASTYQLVKSAFKVKPKGAQALKGIAEPLQVYRVIEEQQSNAALDVIQNRNDTSSIVGRHREIDQLDHLWQQAKNGQGKVSLICGEAGVGKSRLIQAFLCRLSSEYDQIHHLTGYSNTYHESSFLRTLIEMLERTLGFTHDMAAEQRFALLEKHIKTIGFDTRIYVPAFASLLNLPTSASYPPLELSAERRKKYMYEIVLAYLLELANQAPLLLVVEDLHWTDPSTLEFLELLAHQTPRHKILAIFTTRPRFAIPWQNRSEVTSLQLNHLSQPEIEVMVRQLLKGKELPSAVVNEIIDKTDGIPLFVEELTRMVIDHQQNNRKKDNHNPTDQLTIPSSLQDLLTARLDSLGSAREVAQLAAVIGREFSYELLEEIIDKKEDLPRDIKTLIDAELIFQSGIGKQSRFVFKHALIQETAVFTMLRSRRQEIHRKIAHIVETRHPEIVRTMPEYIALHYTRAGDFERAVQWWLSGGEYALKQSANMEAIRHLEQGLFLLDNLPDSKDNTTMELRLRSLAGAAYCATTGYASSEVERTYKRAWELSKHIANSPERFTILWGLWAFYVVRADLEDAMRTACEMLEQAHRLNDDMLTLEAHFSIGLTFYFMADFKSAQQHLEQAIALEKPDRDRAFTYRSGQDAGVCATVYLALTRWAQGYPDEASSLARQGIALARTIDHPFSLAYALNFAGWLAYMQHDAVLASKYSEEEIAISEIQGFFWVSMGATTAGWADCQLKDAQLGLKRMHTGTQHYRRPGARLSQTLLLSMEAEVQLSIGQFTECKALLDEAISAAHDTKEAFWLAETYHLYAKLAHAQNQHQESIDYAYKALNIATQQQAVLPQLRILSSLVEYALTEDMKQSALKSMIDICSALNNSASGPRDGEIAIYEMFIQKNIA